MEQRNYAHIPTYVYKGEAALDAITGSRVAAANSGSGNAKPAAKEKAVADRDRIHTKLDAALAMAFLGQSQYEKAAQAFLKVSSIAGLGGWVSVVSAFLREGFGGGRELIMNLT